MKKLAILVGIIVLAYSGIILAQVKGFSPIETNKLLEEQFSSNLNQQDIFDKEQTPIGDVIIPKYYHIGPGDILAVQNLTTSITTQYLTVTPENSVLIPRIGKISLKGMTLDQASEAILNAYKNRNKEAIVFTSLFKPRQVLVTLSGEVEVKGTFIIPASYRVSTALSMLNQAKQEKTSAQMQSFIATEKIAREYSEKQYKKSSIPELLPYYRRHISVIHNDGTSSEIDMEEARVTGNIELDPYVMENDIIYLPKEPVEFPEISISGSVIRPVTLPYRETDNIEKLLKFGYGFSDDADLNHIIISYANGGSEDLALDKNLRPLNPNIPVFAGTSIIVPQKKKEFGETRVVSVQGNVKNPGSFTLTKDNETLYNVIDMAGGFTKDAYLPLAYILRNSKEYLNRQLPQWSFDENFQYSDLTMEDTTRYHLDVNYKLPVVSCDFVAAFIDSIPAANIVLQDGDIIIVPSNPKTVYVYGQVQNPGYIPFTPGKTLDWYVERAGGYAINAEKSRARIINGRTKVWREGGDDAFVLAGDEIYVPKPPDFPPGIKLQTWAIVSSSVAALATLLNLIFYIIRN